VHPAFVAQYLQVRKIRLDQIVEVRNVFADMDVNRHVNRAGNGRDRAVGVHRQGVDMEARELLRAQLATDENERTRQKATR